MTNFDDIEKRGFALDDVAQVCDPVLAAMVADERVAAEQLSDKMTSIQTFIDDACDLYDLPKTIVQCKLEPDTKTYTLTITSRDDVLRLHNISQRPTENTFNHILTELLQWHKEIKEI